MYSSTSAPLSARPLSTPAKSSVQEVRVKCSLCSVSFTCEAAAFKPNSDPVCTGCLLDRSTGGPCSEEVEDTSSTSDQSGGVCKKSSKQVRFRVGEVVFYPGRSDLPVKESRIFRCQGCHGSVTVVRSAKVPLKNPKSAGAKRLVRSRQQPISLLCFNCCMRSEKC